MNSYILFGEEIVFSDAEERYLQWYDAAVKAVRDARLYFRSYYEEKGNISSVLDGYMSAVLTITNHCAVTPLFESLLEIEIYDVSRNAFEEECWDTSDSEDPYNSVVDRYNEIVQDLEDAKEYRAARKASRGRVVGGGFGLDGALKGMATAGAMNAVSGLGHSIVNGIGNIASSIAASSKKRALYEDEATRDTLEDGIAECVVNIFCAYHDFVNDYKDEIWFNDTFDSDKSNTLLENAENVPEEKRKSLLIQAIIYRPNNEKLLKYLFRNYAEEQRVVYQIAKNYGVDMDGEVFATLISCCASGTDALCDSINYYKPKFQPEFLEEIIHSYGQTVEIDPATCEKNLQDFHRIMKALHVKESKALDDYERNILCKISERYDATPFNEAEEIVSAILKCKVSDQSKREFIKQAEIWELFKQYEISFTREERLSVLNRKYHAVLSEEGVADDKITHSLDLLIDALGFKDKKGNLSYPAREAIFETLTGITEAREKANNERDSFQARKTDSVHKLAETAISASGTDFLTTTLTYRSEDVQRSAKDLKYCIMLAEEVPLVIYDERPFLKPGEFGFCFTNKRFVGKSEYGAEYSFPVDQIAQFSKDGACEGSFFLHSTDGRKLLINADKLSELHKFSNCLNDILQSINKNSSETGEYTARKNKTVLDFSAQCVDENPLLIEYLGVQELAEQINEQSGRNAERQRLIEECTDERLSKCEFQELEDYRNAIQKLRILSDETKASLTEKVDKYLTLIHSCKDEKTVQLLQDCDEEHLPNLSADNLEQRKNTVETHQFLPEEQKQELLNRIVPRLNFLRFQEKIDRVKNHYDDLLDLYNDLGKEPLSPKDREYYKNLLAEQITELQQWYLSKLTDSLDTKTQPQIKETLQEVQKYSFREDLLQAANKQLNDALNRVEQKILFDFCEELASVSISDIESFRNKLEADEFREENILPYRALIDEQYGTLVFEAACEQCKQSSLFSLAEKDTGLSDLLNEFARCGKASDETAPYTDRISALLDIRKGYEEKIEHLRKTICNTLIDYASDVIEKEVVPLMRGCDVREIHAHGRDEIGEFCENDCCVGLYEQYEYPSFYIFHWKGVQKVQSISLTNLALYLPRTSPVGRIIRIPLETITELKPVKLLNNINVSTLGGIGTIHTEVPFKIKETLSAALWNVIKYAIRYKPQWQKQIKECDAEYLKKAAECFADYPIPSDDILPKLEKISSAPSEAPIPQKDTSPEAPVTSIWICSCGRENKGNFCSACGKKKELVSQEWKCACGSVNTKKFCPVCGKSRGI